MRFLDGMTETREAELLKLLRAVWPHDATAIEGNALTLGDALFMSDLFAEARVAK